ncbi:hypothetical protein ENUP19_0331G0016 [Entamoeba nuttalli]|uniref:Ras guanine nucleotide exchange factor, putative n=2 Tax=Entamoeba nuttalli TaxID=412467 RepID=K2HFA6_ENTNP|nr:Ras guanine nucleotide exchange factor, putative [Entamoeba nuttalli P19]EKE41529.1 Ras guanine nucleotide exchange factor, putative [Entamoeba nuttalli P19]|eukprot:XP_008856138.1 Ras guanine nucleotide exchange factor, putative [Entamoeba nuttalli P19]
MKRNCDHCLSLISIFANQIRSIRGIVLENGTMNDAQPHIDLINQSSIDLQKTISQIDCFFSTDDILEIYDTIVATADDFYHSLEELIQVATLSLTGNDSQAKLQFSELIRNVTKFLYGLREGLGQLLKKIPEMRMAVLKPKLRGDFSSIIEFLGNINLHLINKEYSSNNQDIIHCKEKLLSLCSIAVEEGASEEDKKGVILCFKEFVSALLELKNKENPTQNDIKKVTSFMELFKRAIRSMAMGHVVTLKSFDLNKQKEEELQKKRDAMAQEDIERIREAEINKKRREEESKILQQEIEETKRKGEEGKKEIKEQQRLLQEQMRQGEIREEGLKDKEKELSKKIQKCSQELDEITTKYIIEKEEYEKMIIQQKQVQQSSLKVQENKESFDDLERKKQQMLLEKEQLKTKLQRLRGSKITVKKLSNEVKGDLAKTAQRQRILSKEYPSKQLSAVEMRKQLEIDKTARELVQMSDENQPTIIEIAQKLQTLSETLDLDNIEESTDVYQILKQTDFNSIALRITSPKFRISSSISYIGHFVSDDEYDPENKEVTKMIEDYEKEAFYSLAEKASDIATTAEDMMCFGSLSVVADCKESTDDYLSDLAGSCKLTQKAVITFMEAIPSIYKHGSECKGDEGLLQKYVECLVKIPVNSGSITEKKETIEFTYFYEQIIERLKRQEFKPVIKQKYIEASLGLVASVSRKYIYQIINTNTKKIKSIVGQFLAMSKCISHLKPKDFKYLQNTKKFDSKEFEKDCDKADKDSKEQFQKELFYNVNMQRGYDLEILYMLEIAALATDLINTIQDFIDAVYTVIAFNEKEDKLDVMDDSSPVADEIISETKLIKVKDDRVICSSLNQMIYRFVTSYESFREQFFQTYQSFTKSSIVLSKIVSMYLGNNSLQEQVRTQSLIAIKHFVDECFNDLDSKSIVIVKKFINELKNRNEEKNVQALNAVLLRKETELKHFIAESLVPPIDFFIPQEAVSPSMLIQLSDSAEVARQLTLVASKIFNKIGRQEFFNKSWNDESLFPQSVNVIRMLRHSDTVRDWVISSILSFFSTENRVKATIHFIQIGDYLMKLNNFQSLYGIVQALGPNGCISRLQVMDSIPSKYAKLYHQLKKAVHDKNDYKNYRQIVSKINEPYIPLINAFLKDIEKFEDENPKTTKLGKIDVINMKRNDCLADMVNQFLSAKENPYKIPMVEPLSTFLNEMVNLSGKPRDEVVSMWIKLLPN